MATAAKEPLVSCIVTTYKRDFSMLQEAIESIRAQTYQNIEWLVVSDNPPQSEYAHTIAAEMRKYPDGRLIQLPRNSGAQVARNTGILESRGEFLAFLDDDDLWMPEKIEKEMKLFTQEDIGVVFCSGYTFSGSVDNVTELYRPPLAYKEFPTFRDMLYDDYVGSTSQPIIRRAVIARSGLFDPALRARQDYEMWLRISRDYRLRGTLERLFYHRIHDKEQITKNPEVSIQSNMQVFCKYKADYKRNRECAAGLLFRVSRVCSLSGHPIRAFCYRARCFYYHPLRWMKLRLRYANPEAYHKLDRLFGKRTPSD